VISGLLAQGCDAFDASVIGAFVHGAAADALAEKYGDAGALATELAQAIPIARKSLRDAAQLETEERLAVSFPEP
jgi:NAD(P)H-hydrate epimerase